MSRVMMKEDHNSTPNDKEPANDSEAELAPAPVLNRIHWLVAAVAVVFVLVVFTIYWLPSGPNPVTLETSMAGMKDHSAVITRPIQPLAYATLGFGEDGSQPHQRPFRLGVMAVDLEALGMQHDRKKVLNLTMAMQQLCEPTKNDLLLLPLAKVQSIAEHNIEDDRFMPSIYRYLTASDEYIRKNEHVSNRQIYQLGKWIEITILSYRLPDEQISYQLLDHTRKMIIDNKPLVLEIPGAAPLIGELEKITLQPGTPSVRQVRTKLRALKAVML